ncbi:MAG: anaerobic ribonucleoside-triphosphate reductase [Candidatus Pacebacteria bacterium]|nr:anaerobic ribonucleoside-triphosphate reductase [Candidatus Paceibacterota bacterium]
MPSEIDKYQNGKNGSGLTRKQAKYLANAQKHQATDVMFFVSTSDEALKKWDVTQIAKRLIIETGMDEYLAMRIAREVEKQIVDSKVKHVSTNLIREMTNAELLSRGLEKYYYKHVRLGVPIYDVHKMLTEQNRINANVPHNTEATNLSLARNIKKEYALRRVFSQEVAEAHARGDLHLHDLDFIDRPYCCGQSIEYVKKYGLDIASSLAVAKPAKHAQVLILQIIKLAAMLQVHFAGAIGFDAVNLFMAPYLVGMPFAEIRQLAQMLLFEFNMQNVARGGQAIFSDINLYWEVPDHFAKTPAIGPGGVYTGKNYQDYEKESQDFLRAIFEIYLEGDGAGRPFFWPKPNLHITEKFWATPGHKEFLRLASRVAAERGNTYFVLDRGKTARISECCRLSFNLNKKDLEEAKKPWQMRHSAMQNVSLNLPRMAYKAKGKSEKLFKEIDKGMELLAKAHQQKRRFIKRLLEMGLQGPLGSLTTRQKDDPEMYYRFKKAKFLVGIFGVNETVEYCLGQQLHESNEALKLGLKIVAAINKKAKEMSRRDKMDYVLEQTPAEGLTYRFAKLDKRFYPDQSRKVIKGRWEDDYIYYTNSTQLNISENIDPIERVTKEGLFHPLIDAGAISHLWLGEQNPDPVSIASFVKKTFEQTQNGLIAFSPEFTICDCCLATTRGLHDACPKCGSEEVDGVTRVTGFYSRISRWNKGKIGELNDRHKNEGRF